MNKQKLLFVCSMARLRSKTAAHTLSFAQAVTEGKMVDYAGTDKEADRPVTKEQLDWADVIICMENSNRNKLRRKFKGYSHKMVVWNIPDEYDYMDDVLVVRLKGKYEKLVFG